MDLAGERRIPAPRAKVWAALHDVQVLKSCIPGCDHLQSSAEHELDIAIGADPTPSRFVGRVIETHVDVEQGFSLHIDGQNGSGEPVTGTVLVSLQDEGSFTLLRYGARGPEAARRRIDAFLDRFTNEVAAPAEVMASGAAGAAAALGHANARQHNAPAPLTLLAALPAAPLGFPLVFWGGSAVFLAIFIMIFSSYL